MSKETAQGAVALGVVAVSAWMAFTHKSGKPGRKAKPVKLPVEAVGPEGSSRSAGPAATSDEPPMRPVLVQGGVGPAYILGEEPDAWVNVFKSLAPALPLQLHCEPYSVSSKEGPPMFKRAVEQLAKIPQAQALLDEGGSTRARLKLRVSPAGKFIHRNRYTRRQSFSLLAGKMTWLLVNSAGERSAELDEVLGAIGNDNWNGFRSEKYPTMLSEDQMRELQAKLPEGTESEMIVMEAGDVLVFDGRWWHATCYSAPAMSLFLTPGKDMEVAVSEQKRRMKMEKQKGLKVCTVSMAKCSRLAKDWREHSP